MADVDGEPLLLHLDNWTYLSFNSIGARIWELLETPRSEDDLVALLAEEFDAEKSVIARDVNAFLEVLRRDGFVACTEDAL